MKCSLGISNFLEEISSLSHAIVFLYFFALITKEGFISHSSSLELCIQMGISFFFLLSLLLCLIFSAFCKASSDNHFAFFHFFFLGMVLITASCTMSRTSVHQIYPLNLISIIVIQVYALISNAEEVQVEWFWSLISQQIDG